METINNFIEKTKETMGLAEPHEESQQQNTTQKPNDELDLEQHTVLETVKDTIMSVVEMLPFVHSGDQQNEADSQSKDIQQKATELKDGAQQKAAEIKENIQQKTTDTKEAIQKKVEDFQSENTGEKHPQHENGEERITQKMKNWNESLHKLEESHQRPLTKAHENHESKHEKFDFEKTYDDVESSPEEPSSSSSSTTTTEGIQQKMIDLKDATTEKLTQAKDVVLQKGSELKETLSNAQTQIFNKMQGEGEEIKKDENQPEQHTGLVATVTDALHHAFDAGKDLMEKAKDSISDLTTGTANTDQEELKKHVEPIDNQPPTESGASSSVMNTANKIGEKVDQFSESVVTKAEQWTENTLGDVSVVDASEKNKQNMVQPGQPKETGTSNAQPISKPSSA
jgi:hypothetical protein